MSKKKFSAGAKKQDGVTVSLGGRARFSTGCGEFSRNFSDFIAVEVEFL
jgi:hypothetical protein